jgi:hypothetical protein
VHSRIIAFILGCDARVTSDTSALSSMDLGIVSPVFDLLKDAGVIDLTGKVTTISHHPIFESDFSKVYRGVSEGKLVSLILIIRHSLLSDNSGRH